eukprot:jgi/Mesvir1/7773/Mv11716-RA.1
MDPVLLAALRECALYSTAIYFPAAIPETWRVFEYGREGKGAVVTIPRKKRQVVVVRGTVLTSFNNYRTNFDWNLQLDPAFGCKMHAGYADAAKRVVDCVVPQLKDGYAIDWTGHSMGGAVAVCAAALMKPAESDRAARVMTFGQPMVTDAEGCGVLRERLDGDPYWRVVDEDDFLVRFPNPVLFRHFGHAMILKGQNARWMGLASHLAFDQGGEATPAGYLGRLNAVFEQVDSFRVELDDRV